MNSIANVAALSALMKIPFSQEQLGAITAPVDAPQVIIAGAGSGKTTVMAARVVWLVGHESVAPASILGLTFTNKAAAELAHKIRQALALIPADLEAEAEPTVSTYHAFAGTLIAEHGLRLGIEPDLRIISDASRFQRLARVIETYQQPLEFVSTHVPTLIGEVLALDGELAEHLVQPETLRSFDRDLIAEIAAMPIVRGGLTGKLQTSTVTTSRKRIELSRLVDRYRESKAQAGVMDFSDQMAWGAHLAAVPAVGEALRERFGAVLLDEYQDTSVAQRDLLKNLFSGPAAGHGRGHSVTAVGDPAQGIYGWRGAAAGNLAEFRTHFPCADGAAGVLHTLDLSQRCAEPIIDVANTLAKPYYDTTSVVSPLRAADLKKKGEVTAGLFETVDDEIDYVVALILEAHAQHSWSEIAILVREGKEIGAIVSALRRHDVPVEVVGVNGLLSQPEIQDLLSVLEVIEDVTANPALLRLLTGPRWRIGQRDLALLGRRAYALIDRIDPPEGAGDLATELQRAVAGTDPTEVVSLADALEDPGELPYSSEALTRFAQLAGLLRGLRLHVGEPLVDFARRVIKTIDLDLELQIQSTGNGMDNLALLLEAIAAYSESDSYASLRGLLAYLAAENDYNKGMEVSAPSEADSVKLLTAHKAKGLEYECVFVPFMAATVFPSGQSRGAWFSKSAVLPVALRGDRDTVPDITAWNSKGIEIFRLATKEEGLNEERRLGYVAFTRAKNALHVSGHWWGRTQIKPRGASKFLETVHDWVLDRGLPVGPWAAEPGDGDINPFLDQLDRVPWPAELAGVERRRDAAALVRSHLDGTAGETPPATGTPAERQQLERMTRLTADIDLLIEEAETARSTSHTVALPATLSATTALRLADDKAALLRELVRPMPRRPSAAARFGTQFHAWVEAHFGQQTLLDPSDLPGQGDAEVTSASELGELIDAFRTGPYGEREPFAVEAPFSLVLGGQQIIGRIDAIYRTADGFEVVDWKTNRTPNADALQLALYRLAWAELQGINPSDVTAAFYYVRLGEVKRFDDLPDRAGLEALLGLD